MFKQKMIDKKRRIIIDLFSNPYIKKKLWIFKADIDLNKVDFEFTGNNTNYIHWWSGVWENGTWEGGIWEDGTWKDGVWKDGEWRYGTWENGTWHHGEWDAGVWKNGTWNSGMIWVDGTWDSPNGEYKYSTVNPNEFDGEEEF